MDFILFGWDGGIRHSCSALGLKPCRSGQAMISHTAGWQCSPRMCTRGFESLQARDKKKDEQMPVIFLGWDGGIRTPECWHQKPMPYHLATSQYKNKGADTFTLAKRWFFGAGALLLFFCLTTKDQCLTTWRHPNSTTNCTLIGVMTQVGKLISRN
jgi:hypothetical protein